MKFLTQLWQNISTPIRVIIVVILLLNLGAAIILFSIFYKPNFLTSNLSSKPASLPSNLTPTPTPSPTPLPPKDYSLKIGSQSAGLTLTVDFLYAPKEGTLAVYQNNNGQIGPLYSEVLANFEPGTNNGNVFILRTALVPGSYFLKLLDDAGKPVKNLKGEAVSQPFIAK